MSDRAKPGRVRRPADRQQPTAGYDPLPEVPSEYDQGDLIARLRAAAWDGEDFHGPGDNPDPPRGMALWQLILWACLLIPLAEIWQALRARFSNRKGTKAR